ncbi:MAG TPA: NAD(P)H-dependent oxidoreductase [Thermoleophilaceae bacterium]|nr:NAD(P)H-dependent oxidoreductase [Thermoleophilaceae bacterium]
MTRIFATAGSLREGSFNWRLLRRAEEIAPEGIEFDTFTGLADIPFFSQDLEGEATPAAVLDMRARIAAADALLVATPEYNGGMPGVLKNALDWASRPAGASPVKGKPAAVIGASPGGRGAVRGQQNARDVLAAIGANVLDEELSAGRFHELPSEDGTPRDTDLDVRIESHLRRLAVLAGVSIEGLAQSAEYSIACQRLADARA